MPTYDYVCRACEHRFEHFQSMQEAPLRKCPECGRLRLDRLIGSGAGILFKGSGFYETDYKRKSGAPAASDGAGKSGGDSGGKTSAAPNDSKPDAKGGAEGGAKGGGKDGAADSSSKGPAKGKKQT